MPIPARASIGGLIEEGGLVIRNFLFYDGGLFEGAFKDLWYANEYYIHTSSLYFSLTALFTNIAFILNN